MRRLLATLTAFFTLASPAAAAWEWPVSGDVITPYRNGSDPYASGQHRGIDIAAPSGAAVVAAASGEVRFAGTAGSSGLTISIRTADGYDTSYLHLSSAAVREGTHVGAGDRIGAVGTTGTRSATAPHLHFGVRDAGSRHAYHDPLSFLPPPPTPPRAPDAPPVGAPEPAPAGPAPARSGPAPAPVAKHAPSPTGNRLPSSLAHRAPAPAGSRGPSPRANHAPAPVSHQAPSPRANHAPSPLRHSAPAPLERRPPSHVATGAPEPIGHEARAPRTAPSSAPPKNSPISPARGRSDQPATAEAGTGSPNPGRPDLGWALACAGLLLAAGVLGLTEAGRHSAKHGRTRLLGALRPLLGRR